MARTHYEILGLKKSASNAEVRAAYRTLVMKHHPDRSKDPKSTELFIRITEAYNVLSDGQRRRNYDAMLELEARPQDSEQVRTAQYGGGVSPGYGPPKPGAARASAVTVDVTRLSMLFSRGQYSEAEKLARKILSADNRQPLPYAVLGDLARSRGDLPTAEKMYSYAIQMDPSNATYRKRYDELAAVGNKVVAGHTAPQPQGSQLYAPLVGAGLVLLGCFYLALSKEAAFIPELALISTWTVGLMMTLVLSGIAIGASLSAAGMLDRLHTMTTTSLGRTSPTMVLGIVAAISFWAAALLYGLLGSSQRSFNLSTTRLVLSVIAGTVFLAASASASGSMDGFQVLFWGGNIVYLGSLCGWTVADSFRR